MSKRQSKKPVKSGKMLPLTMKSVISPVAPRLRTKLRYSAVYNATTGTAFDQLYRLNSLFDPDESGVGGQPTGFDQLAALYNRYRVWNTRWKFRILSTISSGVGLVLVPSNNTTSLGTLAGAQHAMSLPYAKWTSTASGTRGENLMGQMDLALLNGRTHQQYIDDDTTAALVTANPTEVLDLHMVVFSLDQTTTINANILVFFEYDVEFFDPIQVSSSFFEKEHVVVHEPSPCTTPAPGGCCKHK